MARFSNIETGPGELAALCDEIVALAAELDCRVEGPVLDVKDRQSLERAAIALATENALPLAQTVAELMEAQIVSIDQVIIDGCKWNQDPETRAAQPDIRSLTCTAEVTVRYIFAVPSR
ncbi:MAG TPA: SIMPL domain-containing protein [Candidatus Hydrogenedentes bacterium]|nr:SIMPL domain-containing protein [Candidatus Hydrogenedentota bacterium]